MKVLIDIPQDHKRVIDNLVSDCKGYLLPHEVEIRLARAVKIGTVIPDNATNGDMIKAMFPEVEVQEIMGWFDKDKVLGYRTWLGGRSQDYLFDWWNAPYKKEVEECTKVQ